MSYILPTRWYREQDGKQFGPYTIPELYRLLETGEAQPNERVQAEGGAEWLTILEVLRRFSEMFPDEGASRSALSPDKQARTEPIQARYSNYIVRHWRGDLSLGLSYWLNSFLLTVAINIFYGATSNINFFAEMPYYQAAMLVTAMVSVNALVFIWQIVGTWRSSDRHVSRGGRRLWAFAAKASVILSVLASGLLYAASEVPTVINAWRHAAFMRELPPLELRALRGGTEIELSGGFHGGTAARLDALLLQNSRARVIHLNSVGGELTEGHAVAAIIKSRNLDTYVRTRCLSACTFAFLAGRNRLLREGAQLGFHAPTPVASGVQGAKLVTEEQVKLVRAGMPDWFVSKVFAVRGEAMWFPTIEELLTARVITGTTDGRQLSPGRPNPPLPVEQVERSLRAMPLGAALERVEPAVFRETVLASHQAMNDGATQGDIVSTIERRVTPIYTRSLPLLPDRQIVAVVRTTIETARQIGAGDPRVCRAWLMHKPGQPAPAIDSYITPEQQRVLVQTMADAIITAADPRQRAASPRQAPPQFDQVIRRLEARLPRNQILLLDTIENPAHPPNVVCALVVELYTEILRLPEREAGPLLRFMFGSV